MRAKALLSLVSASLALTVVAAAYEGLETYKYYRWRAQYDLTSSGAGWVTMASPNDTLMWEYRPYGVFEELEMNRYGFRDRDYETPAKPPDVTRVAFVGDSVTLGQDVAADDIFVRRFEARANARSAGRPIQALNFGIDGYNAVQIAELLRTRVLDFEPDNVVYVMLLNDFDFEDSSSYKIEYFRKPGSFVLQHATKLYRRLTLVQSVWPTNAELHYVWFQTNKRAVFAEVAAMHEWLEMRGIGFQVVLLPIFRFQGDGFSSYPLSTLHDEVARFCLDRGIGFRDLLADFRRDDRALDVVALDLWHPTVVGHDFIAAQLLQGWDGVRE